MVKPLVKLSKICSHDFVANLGFSIPAQWWAYGETVGETMVETRERWWKSSGTYGENLVKNMEKNLAKHVVENHGKPMLG